MKNKLLFGIISVIALIALVSAAIYTEPWNTNQRGGGHNLTEMGTISADILNGTSIIGNMDWIKLDTYPVACPTGALTALNDTVTCSDTIVFGGNVTAENVFLPAMVFSHTDNNISVTGAGEWVNITYDMHEDTVKKGIAHTWNDATNDTFTIQANGTYKIVFYMSFNDDATTPDSHIVTRIIVNNVEVNGSLIEKDISGGPQTNKDSIITSPPIYAEFSANDVIKAQFTSDDTSVRLYSHATYGDHRTSSTISIKRIY